jgi:small basic protein
MYIFLGLLLGLLIGLLVPFNIPAEYSKYVAVGLLAALDSVFGGLNAKLSGKFKLDILLSGFFGNTVLAVVLTYLGQSLDIDLYLAAVIAFGSRLFQNFAEIRRQLLTSHHKKGTIDNIDGGASGQR